MSIDKLLAMARQGREMRKHKRHRPRLTEDEVALLYRLLEKEIKQEAEHIRWQRKSIAQGEPDNRFFPLSELIAEHKMKLRLRRKLRKLF